MIENEHHEEVDNILVNIVNSFDDQQTKFRVFEVYFKLLDQVEFSKSISNLNIDFEYNFDDSL